VRVGRRPAAGPVWSARQSGPVTDLAFSPAGSLLVGTGSRGATIWSAAVGRRLHALPSPGGDVRVAFSPDGSLVATAGADPNGRLWFVRTGRLYRVLHGHTRALTGVAFSADRQLVATSSKDSDGRVWGTRSGIGHVLERTAFGPLGSIAFDPSGRWVVGAGPISAILWHAASGRQLFSLRGHTKRMTGVTFP